MKRIGPYQLHEELARGAMGVVFRAHDPALDRDLAVKVVRLEELRSDDAQQRFLREVRIMARLRHRHVIAVHAAGVSDYGYPYVAMDLIEGGSLHDRLKREGRLPIREAVRLAIQLASALDYAHSRDVLHRDLKPHNVLLDGEDALLTDFGLAKWVGANAQGLTQSGERIGTPIYMAPEQALGHNHRVGPATDVYALGVTLFHMLTGVCPFAGPSVHDLFRNIVGRPPASLRGARPEIDAALAAIVHRCLAKEPEDRYTSAGSLRDALRAWQAQADETPGAKAHDRDAPRGAPPSTRQRIARALALTGALGAGVAVGLVGAAPLERSLRRDVWSEELPDTLQALSTRGFERDAREDLEGALEDFDALIAAEPNCSSAWYRRARVKRAQGDVEGAVADLDEAIRIDPELAVAYNLRGLLKLGDDPVGSLADNDRSIELDPLSPAFLLNRAGLHYKEGRDAAALADVERSLALDPRFAQAYYMRGVIKQRTDGAAAALSDWDLAIGYEPGALDARTARGLLRTEQGDPVGAIEDFTAAVASLVKKSTYHYHRAAALEARGEWDAALADLNTAIEIDPGHSLSYARRAKLLLRYHRYEDAVRDYEEAGNLQDEGSEAREILVTSARRVREGLKRGCYSVDADQLCLREGPATTYGIIADLGRGALVRELSRHNQWAKVEIQDQTGQTYVGYVHTAYLSLVIE